MTTKYANSKSFNNSDDDDEYSDVPDRFSEPSEPSSAVDFVRENRLVGVRQRHKFDDYRQPPVNSAVGAEAERGRLKRENEGSHEVNSTNSNHSNCFSDSDDAAYHDAEDERVDESFDRDVNNRRKGANSNAHRSAYEETDSCDSASLLKVRGMKSARGVNGTPTMASSEAFMRSLAPSLQLDASSAASDISASGSIGSAMSQISTKEARNRSFLVGSLSGYGSVLGTAELERLFPTRTMRIFIGTWNMCGMRDAPSSLDNFLLPETFEFVQDAYVVGSQESMPNRLEWELKMQETLGPYYVLFHSGSHGTLHVAIFLRRDLVWYCSVAEEATVTTRPGPSGIKTKGAIGVCFYLFGTSFLFINSHFTAHDGKMDERIEDYKKIVSGLDLPKITVAKQYSSSTASLRNTGDVTSRFDCVFWFGDLNCRLQMNRERLEVLIKSSEQSDLKQFNYEQVVNHDELTKAIHEGQAFLNFQEGRIKFRPTYKYDVGTNDWDSSKKLRTPSYTDRILYRSRKKNGVACLCYDASLDMIDSDHKPVYGLFEVTLRPGVDTIPLSGGQFNRNVWLQGCKKRALSNTAAARVNTGQALSSICNVM